MRVISGIRHLLHGKETGPVGNVLGSVYVPISDFIRSYTTQYEGVHGKETFYAGEPGTRRFLSELAEVLRKRGSEGPVCSGYLEVFPVASLEEPEEVQYEARTTFAERGKAKSDMRTTFTQGALKALEV